MEDAKAGVSLMKIRRVHVDAYTRIHGGVDKVVQAHRPQRKCMPCVYWLWSEAGANKSRMAHAVLKGGTFSNLRTYDDSMATMAMMCSCSTISGNVITFTLDYLL